MTRGATRPARGRILLAALGALLLLSACGGSESPQIAFDSIPPTTSTTLVLTTDPSTTASTEAPLPQLGPWVDATANLAGMPSECGNLSLVAAHPGRDEVIAGVALQGLWVNKAGTDRWTKLGGGAAQILNRTASIVFDPEQPDRFWESGAYSGLGAFRTTDGGRSLEALGNLRHLDGISVDLSDPNRRTLLVGAHERGDLYRSTDGGASWTNLAPNLPPGIGAPSQPLVLSSQVFLVGTAGFADSPGILRSTDAGATWQQVAASGAVGGPALVASDGIIYWPLADGAGLVSSSDGGATWKVVTEGGVLASHNLVQLPDGRLASVGGTHLVISDDQGATWRALGPELPTEGAFGLTYSADRNSIYIWQSDCEKTVQPGSIQRLDISALTG